MKAAAVNPRLAQKSMPILQSSLHCSLDRARNLADLGSDPNSAQRFGIRDGSIPELGSDPNSAELQLAGQRRRAFRGGLLMFSPSSHYSESTDSYYPDNKLFCCTKRRQLTMVRRIGVRAQFGGTPPASFIPFSRIGIRPQICYFAPESSEAEQSSLFRQKEAGVDASARVSRLSFAGAHHVHL
jgi:hypothetical protein